jgi:glycosyltransferase involved in cell wall biosynthesis
LGPIGLDFDAWQLPIQKAKARADLSKINLHTTFIFLGRLLKEKGVVEYLEAAKRVKLTHPSARFLLVGGMDQNPGALSKAEILTYVDQGIIEWPGQGMVSQVQDYLLEADCLVLPSYREGFPRSIQEAMVLGLAVITTDRPGCRQAVENGKTGLIVEACNVKALAEAMTYLIKHPQKLQKMKMAAQAHAHENFDGQKIAQKLISDLLTGSFANEQIGLKMKLRQRF